MIGMNAPTLPPAAPVAPASTASTAATDEVSSGDFLLMLGQLLGAPVASTAAPGKAVTATADTEDDADQATQDAVAMTGLPVTLMADLPQKAPVDAGNDAARSIELLTLTSTGPSTQVKTSELTAALMDTVAKDDGSPSAPTLSAQNVQTPDNTQLRPVIMPDTSPRPLQHPVGSAAWGDELGTRMIMMSERGQHSASLRLSPEHLGPLEVRIAVRDDQASVWFGATNADTRAAIEQALPRLRELFASQGMSLADAGVHHQAPREQNRQTPSGAMADTFIESGSTDSAIAVRLGLVDAYA